MKTLNSLFLEYADLPDFIGMQLHSANQMGHSGDSLLQVAVFRRDIDELECLLAAGADPNHRGEYGYTPLHNAVSFDLPDIVERLLKAGARKDIANDDGILPVRLAKSSRVRELLSSAVGH